MGRAIYITLLRVSAMLFVCSTLGVVTAEQLPPVFAVAKRDLNKPTRLQFYHISKCGGTSLRKMFEGNVHINGTKTGVLTASSQHLYIGQRENSCDPKHCNTKPGDIFIIANIRNPFEFYVSYYNMVVRMKNPYDYGCLGRKLRDAGYVDVYDPKNAKDPETFHRWLDYVLRKLQGICTFHKKSISAIYEDMMFDDSYHEVFDAMVRLEDFYPTLRTALSKYDTVSPGAVDWDTFHMLERTNHRQFNLLNVGKRDAGSVYPCFYTEASRRLVEWHDSAILKRFNYTFEQMGPCNWVRRGF